MTDELTPEQQAACDAYCNDCGGRTIGGAHIVKSCPKYDPDAAVENARAGTRRWVETAEQYARNEAYYRDLCRQIGEAIGPAAYTADDGGVHDSVLNAKLPELVVALVQERDYLRAEIPVASAIYTDIMRYMVNHDGRAPEFWYPSAEQFDALCEETNLDPEKEITIAGVRIAKSRLRPGEQRSLNIAKRVIAASGYHVVPGLKKLIDAAAKTGGGSFDDPTRPVLFDDGTAAPPLPDRAPDLTYRGIPIYWDDTVPIGQAWVYPDGKATTRLNPAEPVRKEIEEELASPAPELWAGNFAIPQERSEIPPPPPLKSRLSPLVQPAPDDQFVPYKPPPAQRWRYEKQDGTAIWLPFDPAFLCIYCNEPVGSLSMGGPAVCPACDCGNNRDGSTWSMEQASRFYDNARRRIEELPIDPESPAQEKLYQALMKQPPGTTLPYEGPDHVLTQGEDDDPPPLSERGFGTDKDE
jgi:hypothetical protein